MFIFFLLHIFLSISRIHLCSYKYREYVYSVAVSQKYLMRLGELKNFLALARTFSFLPTEFDIFDIRQHNVLILFIFQHLIC